MALPTLIDYAAPVPPLRPLPASRATWTLQRDRAAVLVHDLQRYFLRPYAAGCPALDATLRQTAAVLAAARAAGVPVFYTAQRGNQEPSARGLQRDLWGPGMADDPAHTEIAAEVAPVAGEVVLTKHRYSAFARTDLAQRLSAAGRDQLVITGVYAHIGVTATALDAFQREVHPFVVADAVADFGAEQHARALDQVAGCCGVVAMAADVVAALAPAGEPVERATGHWDILVRDTLGRLLPAEVVDAAFTDPDADLFELGFDSLRAFELLDVLADAGADIDFGEFTRRPTIAFLRDQAALVSA